MKSKLKAVNPQEAKPTKPKILIYGKPGVGKTWAALDFPNVYYIDTEGGANLPHYIEKLKKSNGVYLGPEQGSLVFENIIEQVQALATEKHNFKTLVIDSLSELALIETAKEAERLQKEGKKNEFSADKKPSTALTRRLWQWLTRLDMNIVLTCHEKGEWKNGEQTGQTFDAYDKLGHMLHLTLNIVKLADSRIAKVQKTRLKGFPEGETFAWSYKNFAERYGQDIIEKDSENLILVTESQLAEFEMLSKKASIAAELKDKWLTAANIEKFEDIEAEKMESIINLIKTKYLPKGE